MLSLTEFILSLPSKILFRFALLIGGYRISAENVIFIQSQPSTIRRWVKLNERNGKVEDRGESPDLDDFRNSPTGKLIPHDFSWPFDFQTYEYTVRQYTNPWGWNFVTYTIRVTNKILDGYFNGYHVPAKMAALPANTKRAVA